MPEMSTSSPVRVALLNQTNQHGDHLKDALRELGASVVYEALASDIDRDALEGSGARVVVVNLDTDSDARIDEVYDLLDAGDYDVVFNEAQTSLGLSGWDHARWARHLAAKILHRPEISVPPRPPGAEAVPTPVQKSAASVPVAEKPSTYHFEPPPPVLEEPEPVAAPQPEVRARSEAPTLELPVIDEFAIPTEEVSDASPAESLDDLIAAQAPAPESVSSEQTTSDFAAELDALFADAAPPKAAPQPADDLSIDLEESITMESAEPEPVELAHDNALGDFDLQIDAPADVSHKAPEDELSIEFPAIFDQLDMAAADVPTAETAFKSETPVVEPEIKKAGPTLTEPVLPPDWLLDPVVDEEPAHDEKADAAETFGIERVATHEFLAPEVEQATPQQAATLPTTGGLKLELMPMEEAVAPESVQSKYKKEAWLDGSRPAAKVHTGTSIIERVFVLGASIGGPEAVREFLVALPAGFPMLFVLAQHMGEEFLELMSAQLAKAVALTVRNPVHGERIGHGDIVVVPTTHRLKIDTEGVVTLAHLPERPTYNPSIDMVLRDMSDQFGANAGAIIFSGMAHDAIEGSQYMKSRGGQIWVQDPDSCAISTMVDGVKETGVVDFVGSPEQLAAKMIADYKA